MFTSDLQHLQLFYSISASPEITTSLTDLYVISKIRALLVQISVKENNFSVGPFLRKLTKCDISHF